MEIYEYDYLTPDEWEIRKVIKEQLEPLFLITKDLEGNASLNEGACKPSRGCL